MGNESFRNSLRARPFIIDHVNLDRLLLNWHLLPLAQRAKKNGSQRKCQKMVSSFVNVIRLVIGFAFHKNLFKNSLTNLGEIASSVFDSSPSH